MLRSESMQIGSDTVKGFVPTPENVVDEMIERLFAGRSVASSTSVLDPGCGTGVFIEGILRWCSKVGRSVPKITGIELDPGRHKEAKQKFRSNKQIEIIHDDFLRESEASYDFVIGNPPYVSITQLDETEKARYRARYASANGRFDLYLLFLEEALKQLRQDGRLVFITPEKFTYVDSAGPLRKLLGEHQVEEIHFVDEATFGSLVTYPTITSILKVSRREKTKVRLRDGRRQEVVLPQGGGSWLPAINGQAENSGGLTLEDVCLRISCGVATGSDSIFVHRNEAIPQELKRYSFPTISGRQLGKDPAVSAPSHSMIVPYAKSGSLLNIEDHEEFLEFLSVPARQAKLRARTCVRQKPWFAFHENPPMKEILRPKILCKDITDDPHFAIDTDGKLIPRHSVYYLIPKESQRIEELAAYLNSKEARLWLQANCQRAANGFIRLQSKVLKQMPIPAKLASKNSVSSSRPRRQLELNLSL